MGGKSRKSGLNHNLDEFQSANPGKKNEPFLQIGISLLKEPAFIAMSQSARLLYICIMADAKANRRGELTFTRGTADEYGFSSNTLYARIAELENAGFIDKDSGKSTRTSSTYRLSSRWRTGRSTVHKKQAS